MLTSVGNQSEICFTLPNHALHSTVLNCTAMYCTELYCTVLYWTVLHCTVLYCTPLHVLYCNECAALYFIKLRCTLALHCTFLHCFCTAMYCSCTSMHFTMFSCSSDFTVFAGRLTAAYMFSMSSKFVVEPVLKKYFWLIVFHVKQYSIRTTFSIFLCVHVLHVQHPCSGIISLKILG